MCGLHKLKPALPWLLTGRPTYTATTPRLCPARRAPGRHNGLKVLPSRIPTTNAPPTRALAPKLRPLRLLQSARLTRQRYDALQIEGTNRRPPTEYELNRGKAIDALNADATRFADAELDWSIYSEQIQLADPTGARARPRELQALLPARALVPVARRETQRRVDGSTRSAGRRACAHGPTSASTTRTGAS